MTYASRLASRKFGSTRGKRLSNSREPVTSTHWVVASLLSVLVSLNSLDVTAQQPVSHVAPTTTVVRIKTILDIGGAEALAFSPVSKLIAIGNRDCTVQIWDVASGKRQRTIATSKGIPAMYWSPDGERLLITNRFKTASVWHARTGKAVCELIGLRRDIRDSKWSPDGKTIMLITEDDTLKAEWLNRRKTEARLWNAETGQLKFSLTIKGMFIDAKFIINGQRILTAGGEDDPKLWDALSGQLISTLRPPERSFHPGASGIFSPDGRFIAVDCYERGIYLFEAATGRLVATLAEEKFGKNHYRLRGFSPDGKLLAVYREQLSGFFKTESSIELRDGVTGELRVALTGRNMMTSAHQMVWSPDGQTLVTAGGSKKYDGKIWDAPKGRLRATIPMVFERRTGLFRDNDDLDNLSFHPTLPMLMAVNNNFTRFWNPANGELLQTLETTGFPSEWSADGRLLVRLAKDRKSVQIWEPVTE